MTTEQTFGDQLHTYTIVDAINDGNVLPFKVDYISTMKEKEIKRTLRKARVRKNASPEQAKARLISYVGKAKLGKYNLRFPDEYLADPQFLLGLYKANENMFIHEKSWFTDKDLLENVDFVLEYTRLRHASVMKNRVDNFRDFELKNIIDEYSDVMTNPEFVIKFAEEYPHINVFPMMKRASIKSYSSADRDSASKKQQDLERYKKCLASLPTEFLCKWSRMEGAKVLGYIPTDTPNYTEILSAGIERDGFMSLEKLELSQSCSHMFLNIHLFTKSANIH